MNDDEYSNFPVVAPAQIGGSLIQTVNARDLHASLEVGKDFSTWLSDRIRQYDFTENVDFVCSPESGSKGRGGHNRKEYDLSLDMAKELAMVERNDRGKQVRRYFIECERKAQQIPAIDVRNLPQLQSIALQLIEVNREQSEQIAELTPKAEALNRLECSEGSVGPRLAAKMLNMPERKFTAWLQANNWAFRQNGIGPLQAYRDKRDRGYLEHRPHTYYDQVRGEDRTVAQMMITPKGLARLAAILSDGRKDAA